MPGTRKFNPVDETTAKLTVVIPKDIDRELRVLASRQGIAVGPMIRGWLAEKLSKSRDAENRHQAANQERLPGSV